MSDKNLAPYVRIRELDANGNPLAGGKLYTYRSGTSTAKQTYSDGDGTANTNPVVLDSEGSADVWIDDDEPYRFRLETASGALRWQRDGVTNASGSVLRGVSNIAALKLISGSATATTIIDVSGYYAPLDGGGGRFWWDSASTAADDGGIVIKATAFATGRWKRIFDGNVNVRWFGAKGDGATNDSVALQAAISSAEDVFFPAGTYLATALTQATTFQRFYAGGHVNISKNANGALLTCSGSYVEFNGLQFVGTGFTGDNLVISGSHPRLINCASYGAAGRALKATGSHVQVIGTCGVYATTDATASGYDIEIGVSGTATLYHELYGVYTSQATGGFLLIDTGAHTITGGQFGKLTVQAGTTPLGSNGGKMIGPRILGAVSVGLSNSIFAGCQFSAQTITFEAGTSQHLLDSSNNTGSTTIVNNGNSNSVIVKSIGTGSPGGFVLQYGPDAYNCTIRYANDEMYLQDATLNFANNKAIKFADSGGTMLNGVTLSSSNNWQFGANSGAQYVNISAGSGGVYLAAGGSSIVQCTTTSFRANTDGAPYLGTAANRWNTVYATSGAINTSDEREKTGIRAISDAERKVATTLRGMVRTFQFRDAVALKGDSARIHVGVIAQEVADAFRSEGLDPMRYAIICYDEWDASDAVTDGDAVIAPSKEAGNRYGVRYEELLAFIIAAM